MSFDLYLQAFQDGKAAGIAIETIRNVFGKYVVEIDEDFWQLQFEPDTSCDIFLQPLLNDSLLIHTLSIHRPCRDSRLWQSLWLLLELPGTLLYFQGCDAPLARDPLVSEAMPAKMRESLGNPVVVHNVFEISQIMEGI
jgi:hypothetical protein